MAQLLNSFETLNSDGVTITTANSGGGTAGNAFDVATSTGGTRVYDLDEVMNGTRSALMTAPTAGNTAQLGWTRDSWAGSTTQYARMYFRVNDNTPASNMTIMVLRTSDGIGVAADVRLQTTGAIQLRPNQTVPSNGGLHTSSPIPVNTWCRLEVRTHCQTSTTMRMSARLFIGSNANGIVPDEVFGSDAAPSYTGGDGTMGGASFGIISTTGQSNFVMSLDDLGIADLDWLGSANPPPPAFPVPQNLTATPFSDTQINLAWTAFSGATGYDIERNGTIIATNHAGTTYNATGLTPATSYDFRVRAVL
jgi:hypothetical protein